MAAGTRKYGGNIIYQPARDQEVRYRALLLRPPASIFDAVKRDFDSTVDGLANNNRLLNVGVESGGLHLAGSFDLYKDAIVSGVRKSVRKAELRR